MSNSSIWAMDRTLSGATTPGQGGAGSNDNEGVLQIPQISKARASLLDSLISYPGYSLSGVLPLCRDAVNVFYCPSWVSYSIEIDLLKIIHIQENCAQNNFTKM